MASIRQRNGRWQARFNRKGYPPEVGTYGSHDEAVKWSRAIEVAIDQGGHQDKSKLNKATLREALDMYALEVTPSKRGGRDELIRIRALQRRKLAGYALEKLSPRILAEFRDQGLSEVSAGTTLRDLVLISSVVNHARREWGLTSPNPCSLIHKPMAPAGRNRTLSNEEELQLLAELEPRG